MNEAQVLALWRLCRRYGVPFREDDYHPAFDLPAGYYAGWIGGSNHAIAPRATIYVGCSPEGEISS